MSTQFADVSSAITTPHYAPTLPRVHTTSLYSQEGKTGTEKKKGKTEGISRTFHTFTLRALRGQH